MKAVKERKTKKSKEKVTEKSGKIKRKSKEGKGN